MIKTYKDIEIFEYNQEDFNYQQWLTKKLEQIASQHITQEFINEIVL